jgi:zinc protease
MDNLPISNIPGPESISKTALKNGATVLWYKNMDARSVYMIGILKGSGVQDPPGKTGLAHFTANLLSRGTKSQSFAEFHNQLESAGANLSFSCGSQHAWFRGKALAEDVGLLFRLAADGLREPAFKQEYVDRLRGQLLTGLTIRNQDTSEMASLLMDKHLFSNHPYGQPIDGYIETIQSITRTDIVQFHARNYAPNKLIIVVVGAIDEAEVRHLAEAHFASWEKDTSKEPTKKPLPNPPSEIIRKHKYIEGKSQVDLLMGCFGPARISPDYTPVYIGNNILGQFGLMGRIGKSVRSKSGLAYYASSSVSAWSDVGTWEFSAGVNPENVEKAINLIRKEIWDFTKKPVYDGELDNSKSHLLGRMPMSLESNAGLANAILTMQRFNLGLDYYQNYKDRIQSVTANQILESSRKYLHPDRLVITSAGTGEDIQ